MIDYPQWSDIDWTPVIFWLLFLVGSALVTYHKASKNSWSRERVKRAIRLYVRVSKDKC